MADIGDPYGLIQYGHDVIQGIVDRVLNEYEGGPEYFDALDELLRTDEVFAVLTAVASAEYGPRCGFVVTGRFATQYEHWSRRWSSQFPLITIPQSLRYSYRPPFIEGWRMRGVRDWVLLDDTLYRGRTLMKVQDAFRNQFHTLSGAVVAYDGSKIPFNNVISLYRYFDEHKSIF